MVGLLKQKLKDNFPNAVWMDEETRKLATGKVLIKFD